MRSERVVVEMPTRKPADIRMHPELNVELEHLFSASLPTQLFVEALHEGPSEAVSFGFEGEDRRRKLQRVADNDHL